MEPTNLLGLDAAELEQFVTSVGEKPFRGRQLFHWLYGKAASTFDEMTELTMGFRRLLAERAQISKLALVTHRRSARDGSTKFLFQCPDGARIESVLMQEDGRTTLCLSTQVGCAIDCKFCATGMMGLQRHLEPGEIVDQLLAVQRLAGLKISNVVCMGMGEPFHNYDNVMKACDLLTDPNGPGLAKRRIVVSTSGLVPKVRQFADENRRFRLAVSLNATTDEVRERLMPLNKKWPIRELLRAVKYYTQKSGQRVTFEYVLLAGINDSVEDAVRLKHLVKDVLCKVNLIPYNATMGSFRRPSEATIQRFYAEMASLRAPVTIRWSKGDDISAGCGQLAGQS